MTDTRKAAVAYATENDGKIVLALGPGDHTCERWEITSASALMLYKELHKIVVDRVHESNHVRWWLTEGRGR